MCATPERVFWSRHYRPARSQYRGTETESEASSGTGHATEQPQQQSMEGKCVQYFTTWS